MASLETLTPFNVYTHTYGKGEGAKTVQLHVFILKKSEGLIPGGLV